MPGFDGTGPLGLGPLTGRGLGPCGRGLVRRLGFRRSGRGFGFRIRNFSLEPIALTKNEEKKILEDELKDIEAEKEEVEKRLKELKK